MSTRNKFHHYTVHHQISWPSEISCVPSCGRASVSRLSPCGITVREWKPRVCVTLTDGWAATWHNFLFASFASWQLLTCVAVWDLLSSPLRNYRHPLCHFKTMLRLDKSFTRSGSEDMENKPNRVLRSADLGQVVEDRKCSNWEDQLTVRRIYEKKN